MEATNDVGVTGREGPGDISNATPGMSPCRATRPAVQILIVEDEGLVAKDIARALVRLGYDVVGRVPSGEEAAHQAMLLKPDLILMDVQLRGELDGIGAAKLIRRGVDIPVVFLTAFSDKETLDRAMSAQPFGYVVKPFQQVELRCAIEVALNRHRMESAVRSSEETFRRLSTIDELTGLPNRRGFIELAEQQLKIARRYRQPLVLCFADLDGLKLINDNLGHAAGDEAIRAGAGVLRETFRGADIVARLAGDEFAVLAIATSEATLEIAVRRLAENLARFNASPHAFTLDMSIGMAHHDAEHDHDIRDLMIRADAAMYSQKEYKRSLAPARVDAR
jgi:two-component system cell cycle response regulator